MLTTALDRVVSNLRRWTRPDQEPADGALLLNFRAQRDEASFAILVRRHGPLVLGVCTRLLGSGPDAEDAFQATFLVLARKAAVVNPPDLVGNWLYGVAYRTALQVRSRRARQRAHEIQVAQMPHPMVEGDQDSSEFRQVLDEELIRLPEKYRAAVVLCELEGRSRQEAAALLKIPEGTLSSRLAAARKLLAHRFRLRGYPLSALALSAILPRVAAATTATPALVALAAQAARGSADLSPAVVAIAEGVMRTMFLAKWKIVAVLALSFCLSAVGLTLALAKTFEPGESAAQGPTQRAEQNQHNTQINTQQDRNDGLPNQQVAGPEATKKAVLGGFTRIHLQQGHAVIRQSAKETVEVSDGLPATEPQVDNGTLVLNGRTPNAKFVVAVKDLAGLSVDGVGAVEVLDLKGKKLELIIAKPAQVRLTGSVQELLLQVAAGARVDASACSGNSVTVRVAGGGSAVVAASNQLHAEIAPGGKVTYLGTPRIENKVRPGGQLLPGSADAPAQANPAPKDAPLQAKDASAQEPSKGQPLPKGAVHLNAVIDGYTQGTMFNTQKYPFKYTGAATLTGEQLKSLATAGQVPGATAKALLACILWPKMNDTLQKAVLTSDGAKLTGEAEVLHHYGKQGVHVLKMRVEGVLDNGRLTLTMVNPTVTGSWDYGGGKVDLVGKVSISISAP